MTHVRVEVVWSLKSAAERTCSLWKQRHFRRVEYSETQYGKNKRTSLCAFKATLVDVFMPIYIYAGNGN